MCSEAVLWNVLDKAGRIQSQEQEGKPRKEVSAWCISSDLEEDVELQSVAMRRLSWTYTFREQQARKKNRSQVSSGAGVGEGGGTYLMCSLYLFSIFILGCGAAVQSAKWGGRGRRNVPIWPRGTPGSSPLRVMQSPSGRGSPSAEADVDPTWENYTSRVEIISF